MKSVDYHPNRFLKIRPSYYRLINSYRSIIGLNSMTMEGMQELFGIFVKNYNVLLDQIPIENRPDNTRFLKDEFSYFIHFCKYYVSGKNIFSINPDLVEKFYYSDTIGINVSDLKFPYKSFYLAFGLQDDLELWNNGYFVDGAYISNFNDEICEIVLSTKRKDISYNSQSNFLIQDKYFYFSIETTVKSLSIEEAVSKTLENDSLYKKYHSEDISGLYDINGQLLRITDISEKSNNIDLQLRLSGFEVFKKSLNLIFNSLCFITAYSEKIVSGFPDDCPEEIIQQVKNKKKNKLNPLNGFTHIKFVGNRNNGKTKLSSEQKQQTHWRRGHWRNQACGQNKTEHKLIWIMPTLVNRIETNVSSIGHIYEV